MDVTQRGRKLDILMVLLGAVALAGCERGSLAQHHTDAGTSERPDVGPTGDAGCVEWGGEFAQACPDAGSGLPGWGTDPNPSLPTPSRPLPLPDPGFMPNLIPPPELPLPLPDPGFVPTPTPSCEPDSVRLCYPGPTDAPPAGCAWGSQVCEADGRWGHCAGGTMPPEGEDSCECVAEGGVHTVYDAYLAAYTAAEMPRTATELGAYRPSLAAYPMAARHLNPGNELVDRSRGGLTHANLREGLARSRTSALATAPAGSSILAEVTSPIGRLVTGANHPEAAAGTCNGVGWLWGSILFRAPDASVGELVFHYVGVCVASGDGELFTHLSAPAHHCTPPLAF